MKQTSVINRLFYTAVLCILYGTASAQYNYWEQAILIGNSSYGGTARSEAMGHAIGTMGGDFTSLSINPAGLGIYNKSEFTFTTNVFSQNNNTSTYAGLTSKSNRTKFNLDNLGYVFTSPPSKYSKVRVNFGIGYNRLDNFFKRQNIAGEQLNSSMTEEFARTGGVAQSSAYETYLIDQDENGYYSIFEPVYTNPVSGVTSDGDFTDQYRRVSERGAHSEYLFSGSASIDNMIYLGLTLSLHDITYSNDYLYQEDMYGEMNPNSVIDGNYDRVNYAVYDHNQELRLSGSGFGAKFGIIIKPINEIRIGGAIHTPTRYNINEEYWHSMYSDFANLTGAPLGEERNGNSYSISGDINVADYVITEPWRYTAGISTIILNRAALNFDYEYTDFSKAEFKESGSAFDASNISSINNEIEAIYDQSHTYRVGAELRVNKNLSLRGGYQDQSDPYNKRSGLSNGKISSKKRTISGGFGYNIKQFAIDLSYSNLKEEYEEYMFQVFEETNSEVITYVSTTTAENIYHKAKITLSWKL